MAVRAKNKTKRNFKKTKPASGKKDEAMRKSVRIKAGGGKRNGMSGSAGKKQKTDRNGDTHLAKWIAPNFILTNQEVLVYRLCVAGSPFMFIWSILGGNFISAITFLLAFTVCVEHLVRKPEKMEYILDIDGIKMGGKKYAFDKIESFEVDDEARIMKFKLKNAFLPQREIYLEDQDPNYIRAVLEYFLPEEKQEAVISSRNAHDDLSDEAMTDEEMLSYLEKMEKKIGREDL